MNTHFKPRILAFFLFAAALGLAGISLGTVMAQTVSDLKLPAHAVASTHAKQEVGGDSFFHIGLNGVGAGYSVADGVEYLGWCIEPYTLRTSPAPVQLLSSYAPDLPEDVAYHLGRPIPWDKINWVLNNKQGQPNNVIQPVIWYLITQDRQASQNTAWHCPEGSACDALLNQAEAEGAGFIPQPGQVMAVILRLNGINEEDDGYQETIIEVELPEVSETPTPETPVPDTPEIDIRKQEEGDDTRFVLSNTNVDFEIVVTNTGPVDLEQVEVTDELAPECARSIGFLAAGESFAYSCTVRVALDSFTNVACASGRSGDASVSDCDPSSIEIGSPPAPGSIDIRKQAEGPDSRPFHTGSDVTFEILVTNTGGQDLTNVVVTDELAPGCARSIGSLAAGESFSYTCTAPEVEQSFTNTACASGQIGAITVEDCDPSTVEIHDDYRLYFPIMRRPLLFDLTIGFEDMAFENPGMDYDYNDWVASIETQFTRDPGTGRLQRIDFHIIPRARGGTYNHVLHMLFPANTFESDGIATLTLKDREGNALSTVQSNFTASQDNDFIVIPSTYEAFPEAGVVINVLEGSGFKTTERTALLSIQFSNPIPFPEFIGENRLELPHGTGLFFDPYLHVIQNGLDLHRGDPRLLCFPGIGWQWPEEQVRIDRVYTQVNGEPPYFTFSADWWKTPNQCIFGDGIKCEP